MPAKQSDWQDYYKKLSATLSNFEARIERLESQVTALSKKAPSGTATEIAYQSPPKRRLGWGLVWLGIMLYILPWFGFGIFRYILPSIFGGILPLAILIAGIDNGEPKLFETDPTGIFFQYHATVIGEGETEIEEILHKEYNKDITIEDALNLGIRALSKVVDQNFNVERLDCVYIKTNEKKFVKVSKETLSQILNEVKKKKQGKEQK